MASIRAGKTSVTAPYSLEAINERGSFALFSYIAVALRLAMILFSQSQYGCS
jgi:hypothetical protein